MNPFNTFKETTDIPNTNKEIKTELDPEIQIKFERLMGDDLLPDTVRSETKNFPMPKDMELEPIIPDEEIELESSNPEDFKDIIIYSMLPRNGEWSGEEGDSTWYPERDHTPKEKSSNPEKPYSNPDNLTWEEILKKYGIDGIPFKDGEPDFSAVQRGKVEIDEFTDDRASNFDQADIKMAEQRGCTPEEVAKWRKENNYTWHEHKDCKTMEKVPNEIHANVPHSGGVSEYKKKNEA